MRRGVDERYLIAKRQPLLAIERIGKRTFVHPWRIAPVEVLPFPAEIAFGLQVDGPCVLRQRDTRHLGANGYIPKDARPAEIANAIRTIAAGGNYLPEPIRRIYEARKAAKGLTEREVAILRYIAKGLSYHEIGEQYNISVNTVKIHVRHIFEKLDVSDRTEAVTLAIARGIIEG